MTMFQEGYQMYLQKCEQFGLEPVNFRYYVIQLSQAQLHAYNDYAQSMKGQN